MFRWLALFLMVSCSPAYAGGHDSYPGDMGEGSTFPCCDPNPETFMGSEDNAFNVGSTNADKGETPMHISVVRPPEGELHFADVHIHNRLVFAFFQHDRYDFVIKDEIVTIIGEPRSGDEPDTFTVLPPAGYIAIPNSVTLDEGANAIIKIYPNLLG